MTKKFLYEILDDVSMMGFLNSRSSKYLLNDKIIFGSKRVNNSQEVNFEAVKSIKKLKI